MFNPIATYRIQFHKQFNFEAFEAVLEYLDVLGVGSIYASPIAEAVSGSTHGYDGINPNKINPEIGTVEKFMELGAALTKRNICWIQDIVPNHMAFHPNNEWLMDLLENGSKSHYTTFFDSAWSSDFFKDKLIVPFLKTSPEEAIASGDLKLDYQQEKLMFSYFESLYPLKKESYTKVFGDDWKSKTKEKLVKDLIENSISNANQQKELLLELVNEQGYRLCAWQESVQHINYRRFFTINSLICLNIQNKEVFNEVHKTLKTFIDIGLIQGLRVDHIDGLFNPNQYLERLRKLFGPEVYIVVEKILEQGETLQSNWPIEGSTGYDFMATLNAVFTNKESAKAFTEFYNSFTQSPHVVAEELHEKKEKILYNYMGGELENLFRLFLESNLLDVAEKENIGFDLLKTCIAEFLILCPVYRYYGTIFPLEQKEEAALSCIFEAMKKRSPNLIPGAELLENALIIKPKTENEGYRKRALLFYQRCMQFTGPLMAKGLEDTLMYTYNRFIGHNEVGDSPDSFGLSPDEFHQQMVVRQSRWPLSMNASATHDTKRGEDARARLNVLTDLAGKWIEKASEWQKMNAGLKKNDAPDANDEYFIYQTLVGVLPMPGEPLDSLCDRLQKYIVKALREAKLHTNYTHPNEKYENETCGFIASLLDGKNAFYASFLNFHYAIADFGIINSISQLIIKFTCPGVPDVYQGTELWDFSLVDPDNRRPVDYHKRMRMQQEISDFAGSKDQLIELLWKERYTGKIKLWLTQMLFALRRNHPELFLHGLYLPLEVSGTYKNNILAFARKYQDRYCLVVLPLHPASLELNADQTFFSTDWKDTTVLLPANFPEHWKNTLNHAQGLHAGSLSVATLFNQVPFAILNLTPKHSRGSGLLMHITSLPSAFGIGDLGPEAKRFATMLSNAGQTYWQLLPLNPIGYQQAFSPYSSVSGMAGNTLLISPELLVKDGVIEDSEIKRYKLLPTDKVSYQEAKMTKNAIFERAWQNFKNGVFSDLKKEFNDFCIVEDFWLHDFALYIVIKGLNAGKPWHLWQNEDLKNRRPEALKIIARENNHGIEKTKWLQFLFFRQWKQLRTFCSNMGICLVGDMPFYVSHNSVDVWANKELFSLDAEGGLKGIAGVPPDAFSDDGQLWGMPVYNWKALKKTNYAWWIQRFKKNMELFDSIRLDHFRAFVDYWEVPATENTAKNGSWKQGPGAELFRLAEQELGHLPFIAEDLGDINDAVLELRDTLGMPGMKVLQFAFNEEMPWSAYAPHNYKENFIVYTGTHDNNTSRGWARLDGKTDILRLERYLSRSLKEDEVAEALIRLAFGSVAKTAIVPIQDLINLDESARMNKPASLEKNWVWRLLPGQLTQERVEKLKQLTILYNRNK
jgi:malto-oligosyltrehalose synthase/4-alpha-glucanotransferase